LTGCGGSGEGWPKAIPEERKAPFRRPGAAGILGRLWNGLVGSRDGSGVTLDHTPESAHSPQKVRNLANLRRCRPSSSNSEIAGQPQVPSNAEDSRTVRVVGAGAALRELGSSSVVVCTPSADVAAVATYASAGYRRVDEVPDLCRSA
jgi:hypothetical protein